MAEAPDQYDSWKRMIAGEAVTILAEQPLPGFYKTRRAPGPWLAVAIWRDEETGDLLAQKGVKEVAVGSVWPWCAKTPVTYAVYQKGLQTGEFPPDAPAPSAAPERAMVDDEIPADRPQEDERPQISTGEERVGPEDIADEDFEKAENGVTIVDVAPVAKAEIGHNAPPDNMALTKEDLLEALRLSDKLVKAGVAKSDEEEAAGNALIKRLLSAEKEVKAHRRDLVKPFEAEIDAINAVWMPLEKKAGNAVAQIKQAVTGPYLAKKRADEERQRQEEAKRKREEAEQAAAAAEADQSEEAQIAAARAQQQASTAARQASAKSTVSSGGGTTKMRKVNVANVTDPSAFAAFLLGQNAPNEELLTLLRTIANRMVSAGAHKPVDIPGIEVSEETRFA